LRFDIVTLFPGMFDGPFAHSMIARAIARDLVEVAIHDLRQWATDRHRTTDDYAFGGGGGMVMKPEPVFRAVEELLGIDPVTPARPRPATCPILLMSPQGVPFTDGLAREFAAHDRLVILCGRYEGFDERIRLHLPTHEVSVGDFVVTGGELPAMLVAEAVARLRPGVLGLESGTDTESFAEGLLEYPHYTRPADFRGFAVPEVLLSGNHGEVARWRRRESLLRTRSRRPDLLAGASLSDEERLWLADRTPTE
jgi:tRNA (guanine37-N1)-methyltransferase